MPIGRLFAGESFDASGHQFRPIQLLDALLQLEDQRQLRAGIVIQGQVAAKRNPAVLEVLGQFQGDPLAVADPADDAANYRETALELRTARAADSVPGDRSSYREVGPLFWQIHR